MLWGSCFGYACDNCNIYLNLSPNDYKNSIGLYMRNRLMFGEYNLFGEMIATKHAGHGNDLAFWGQQVHETYQTYEIRGNFFFKKRWKTSFILPFINNNQQIGNVERYKVRGVGDPILLQSFQVFNTKKDTVSKTIAQRLTIGGGLKFPLGKTDLTYANGTPNLDLQPGTGSWDFLTYVSYSMKWKFIGTNVVLNLKKNGKDSFGYRYGMVFNGNANLFTDVEFKKFTVRLLGGAYIENAKFDTMHDPDNDVFYQHHDTGGRVWFANTGLQLFTRRMVLFAEFQKAVKNNLNGYTQLLTKHKINVGITYNF